MKEIIEENKDRWEELEKLLTNFRDGIEIQREMSAKDIGLSPVNSFFNILIKHVKEKII